MDQFKSSAASDFGTSCFALSRSIFSSLLGNNLLADIKFQHSFWNIIYLFILQMDGLMCIHGCLAYITKQQKEKQREKGKLGCLIFWFSHIYGVLSSGFVTLSVLRTTEACLHCLICFTSTGVCFRIRLLKGNRCWGSRVYQGPRGWIVLCSVKSWPVLWRRNVMEEKLHTLWDRRSGDHVGIQIWREFWVRLAVPAENTTENLNVLFILQYLKVGLKKC